MHGGARWELVRRTWLGPGRSRKFGMLCMSKEEGRCRIRTFCSVIAVYEVAFLLAAAACW